MPKHIYSILFISNLFSQVDYYTQIQPIFDNNCIGCHIDGGAYFGGNVSKIIELFNNYKPLGTH